MGIARRVGPDRTLGFSVFRRIDGSSEWSGGKGLVSSLETLLFGRENTPFHRAWGADLSEQMDLAKEDQADDLLFNEVIWRSVKGADSPMPAPVRAAFVLPEYEDDDDEDD